MMEVKVEFRSITGAVCDASITRPQSFAEALALAVVGSSSTIASAFSFVKHDMANVALYYNVCTSCCAPIPFLCAQHAHHHLSSLKWSAG